MGVNYLESEAMNEYICEVTSSEVTETIKSRDKYADETNFAHPYIQRPYKLRFWIIYILTLVGIYLAIKYWDNKCWTCGSDDICNEFNATTAKSHLLRVTGFGPRPAGSIANEMRTADYLREQLKLIKKLAHHPKLLVEFDEQLSDRAEYASRTRIVIYENIRNFAFRLHDQRNKSSTRPTSGAVLINCHFDTVPPSPGASDAFVNCAVMLEVLRALVEGDAYLHNDIIFLFNGAEESGYLGSRVFISQHPWANDVAAFVNLEGAGSGKRLLLFQMSPGSATQILIDAYQKSFSQPYASVMAEDIFQSGKIPSDTDFRIFQYNGGVPGMDLAYVHDGYAYHTEHDTAARISDDCFHQSGRNLLKLVRLLAAEQRIQYISTIRLHTASVDNSFSVLYDAPSIQPVYFDIFGLTLCVIPWWLWKCFNYLLVVIVCLFIIIDRRFYLPRWLSIFVCLILQVFTVFIGFLIVLFVGYMLHTVGCRMVWYSNHFHLVGIYILPFVCWFVFVHTSLFRLPDGIVINLVCPTRQCKHYLWNGNPSANLHLLERDMHDTSLLILSILMIIPTVLDYRVSYICTLWVVQLIFHRIFYVYKFPYIRHKITKTFSLIFLCIILFYHVYIWNILFDFVIPVTGRLGQLMMPDIIIGMCVCCAITPVAILSTGWLQGTKENSAKILQCATLIGFFIYILLIHISSFGFPYYVKSPSKEFNALTSPRYQRLMVFHETRYLRLQPNSPLITRQEGHFVLIPLDVNAIRYLIPNSYWPLLPTIVPSTPQMESDIGVLLNNNQSSCDMQYPYCGIATPYPLFANFPEFRYIPTRPHSMRPKIKLLLLSQSVIKLTSTVSVSNFTFALAAGPPNTNLLIQLNSTSTSIHSWSFDSHSELYSNMHQQSDQYFITYLNPALAGQAGDTWKNSWTFWLALKPRGISFPPNAYFDLAITGMYVDLKIQKNHGSPDFEDFITRLPPWVTVDKAYTVYDHWRFQLKQ